MSQTILSLEIVLLSKLLVPHHCRFIEATTMAAEPQRKSTRRFVFLLRSLMTPEFTFPLLSCPAAGVAFPSGFAFSVVIPMPALAPDSVDGNGV